MGLYESLQHLTDADDDAPVDWTAAADAAAASTPRGELELDEATVEWYHQAVVEARDAVSETVDTTVELPSTVEVLDRHHWIEQAALSFDRMLATTLPDEATSLARTINTASAAMTLAVLSRRVVGQYEPGLFGKPTDEALFIVEPNAVEVADELGVDRRTFRRWVLHHEVVHAAEFSLAPWLRPYLEERFRRVLATVAEGRLDRDSLDDITLAMTAVEGFAELLMDEAFAGDATVMRDRLDARRAGIGPIQQVIDWVLGITSKRQQYARGRAFFEAVADDRGVGATLAVWEVPEHLPTAAELAEPDRWLDRVDPPLTDA